MVSVVLQLQQTVAGQHKRLSNVLFAGLCVRVAFYHQAVVPPVQGRPFQSLLYIHVIAAVVGDDDAEVGILGDSEQLFHVRDELQHPTCLVLHWLYCNRERNKAN